MDMDGNEMCPRSREANMSLLRNMMFQYSGGSRTFWRPKIHGFYFFSGRASDWIPSKSWADLWGNKKATFCHQNCCEWPIVTSNKPAGSAQLRCFRTSSHKAGPGLPLLGPGGRMACLWWYSFFVADHRFHVCCLAEYGSEWPWTKQTLRGLGLVWDKHPHVPTTVSLSPVFF